jgi:arylsulfatase A-like enzyme
MISKKHPLQTLRMTVSVNCIVCFLSVGAVLPSAMAVGPRVPRKPNFIVIFTDDQGYQDLGCFGSPAIRTPNIDGMADEGIRFTHFYAQTVCGPSRAALMTGCYPLRVGKKGNNQNEIHPFLHTDEITVAEILKEEGYKTACFGKWDLAGHRQKGYDKSLLPTRQGFDYFFGTPTSNDSVANLLRNEELVEPKADMADLTKRYTDEALGFIQKSRDQAFFVYLAHTMPHLKLAASEQFRGKSRRGLYGDVIEEIDFSVGRILQEIRTLGLEQDTYIIFTSDNGPWFLDRHPRLSQQKDKGGSHGGDAAPLRGHKTSTWEGGVRVPCVMWAPGRIPQGKVCSEIATTMDVLPTLAALAGSNAPTDRAVDGKEISDLIHGKEGAKSPTEAFYYYAHTQLMAVRSGKWKLHLPRTVNTMQRWNVYHRESDIIDFTKPLLYDLEQDPGEQQNLADKHPDTVRKLIGLANWARNDIGDYDRIGKNARFFDPQPRRSDITQ